MSEAIGNLMVKGGLKGSGHFARMSSGRNGGVIIRNQKMATTYNFTDSLERIDAMLASEIPEKPGRASRVILYICGWWWLSSYVSNFK